eukprot:s78_g17.t1
MTVGEQLKNDENRIHDIFVVGNADGDIFALPTAYNVAMGHHLKALREEFAIQNIDATMMLARTVRYDKIHLEDEPINRKLITSFLRAAVDVHLSYLKLIGADDSLRLKPT